MKPCIALMLLMGSALAHAQLTTQPALDPRYLIGQVIFRDDFQSGESDWHAELENGGKVEARQGKLVIDVPAGASVWFKQPLEGPVLIEYDATVIKAGGPNDRVSDLNCFWMATDPRAAGASRFFDVERSGKFADYNQLRCYYVGLGGNTNTTTRFRRYIGSATTRPLLPEHDLQEQQHLIKPNTKHRIQLVACGSLIQYWRDGTKLFEYHDTEPYTKGWFAFRTVSNHMTIENFQVRRLEPRAVHMATTGLAAPARLTVEYQTNPLGLTELKPRFSWWVNDDRPGARQTAYQIGVGSSPDQLQDVWHSGKTDSDQSVLLDYAGAPLESRRRYSWRVRTWDKEGNVSDWSQPHSFEMGLLNPKDWSAKWIGANLTGSLDMSVPAPYFRRAFEVQGQVARARLYITALGVFEASINGQRVGDERLAPGFTDYHKRLTYRTYDVTSHIKMGTNAIGAIVADGWYCGYVGFRGRRQNYGDRPMLLAQLEITTADGKTQAIVTDESWRVTFGPLVSSDLLMGESYNAQLEMPGWDSGGFDDSKWIPVSVGQPKVGQLVASMAPPMRAVMQVKPIELKRTDGRRGRWLIDMGQNMVGVVRLKIRGPAGKTVTIRQAEMLNPDGTLWVAGLRKARATDVYQCKGGGEEVFEPRFTFHGFRYVEIEGYPGELGTDDIAGVVVHSDTPVTGSFTCSNDLLNKLQSNIVWGQRGNFIDIPTDCPQRDERMGWTGDIQVFARTACFNMNVAGFLTKWLDDLDDAQRADGAYPSYAPNFGPDFGGPAWADAGVIVPWTVYQSYGDKRILERHYPAMQKYLAFLEKQYPNGIAADRGYGDWLATDTNTSKPLIGTAFFAHSADLMSQIARVLGKDDEAATYRATFERVRDAFNKEFVTPNGRIVGDSQTAYVLALQFNLLPQSLRDEALGRLVADIKKRNNHLSTGFVGTPYLLHVVDSSTAYALLEQTTFPSWLFPVTQGATTIWERWDGWTPDKGFQDAGMNSFNHYAYGAVGEWMYQRVAGIEPIEPGYRKIRIRPTPGGTITSASATLDTVYGTVRSAWKRDGDVITHDMTIPPNTTAVVELPGQEPRTVEAGIHQFNVTLKPQ
jgi:alpha-L-rhamnosidase